MYIAKVTGCVWATQKAKDLERKKLLLTRKMSGQPPSPKGETILAVCDKIDAGIGDIVLVLDEGGSARSILDSKTAPVRTIIVGIIDQISIFDNCYYASQLKAGRKDP